MGTKNPMTPEQIKKALATAGCTQSRIAMQCGVTKPAVNQVINDTYKSHRIRCAIATAIRKPVENIWHITPESLARVRSSLST